MNIMNFHYQNYEIQDLRNQLSDIRILQKNLVYIIGLPDFLLNKKILFSQQFLGQYGKIQKINICQQYNSYEKKCQNVVYVLFQQIQSAFNAVICLNKFKIDNQKIKVSFGMTRLCKYFILQQQCQIQGCSYIHHIPQQKEITFMSEKTKFQKIKRIPSNKLIKEFCMSQFHLQLPLHRKIKNSFFPSIQIVFDEVILYLKTKKCQVSKIHISLLEKQNNSINAKVLSYDQNLKLNFGLKKQKQNQKTETKTTICSHTNIQFLSNDKNDKKKCFIKKNTFEEINYPQYNLKDLKSLKFNQNEQQYDNQSDSMKFLLKASRQ